MWRAARLAAVVAATCGLLWANDRWRFAGGLVALGVGVGIAGPHLPKSGWTVVGTGGLLALVSGACLVLVAAARIVRSTSRWWRLVVAPSLTFAVGLALLALGQAVAATNVPPTTLGERTPADLALTHRDVSIRTQDGVELAAWYVPSTNGAAVLCLTGRAPPVERARPGGRARPSRLWSAARRRSRSRRERRAGDGLRLVRRRGRRRRRDVSRCAARRRGWSHRRPRDVDGRRGSDRRGGGRRTHRGRGRRRRHNRSACEHARRAVLPHGRPRTPRAHR